MTAPRERPDEDLLARYAAVRDAADAQQTRVDDLIARGSRGAFMADQKLIRLNSELESLDIEVTNRGLERPRREGSR